VDASLAYFDGTLRSAFHLVRTTNIPTDATFFGKLEDAPFAKGSVHSEPEIFFSPKILLKFSVRLQ